MTVASSAPPLRRPRTSDGSRFGAFGGGFRPPATRRSGPTTGRGQHSIQFFDVVTGDLAADYNL